MEPSGAQVCATCHDQGRGCCTLGSAGEREMFPLTLTEVEVIAKSTRLKPVDFLVADRPPKEFVDFAQRLHPLFGRCMPDGIRLRLRITAGQCSLLGPQGCRLPSFSRPLYCRLYPFFFDPDDRLMVLISERCLAQEGARTWREVLVRMNENEENLRRLFGMYQSFAASHALATNHLLSQLVADLGEPIDWDSPSPRAGR